MTAPDIDIVLPVYNGADFLAAQLDSLQRQSFTSWRVLIRDDGSSDATPDIIKSYAEVDERILILSDEQGKLGAIRNFSCLLAHTRAEYVVLCDQDDVWLPDKIEKSLNLLLRMEKDEPGIPLLVHSDLKVVDQSLKEIAPSFWQFQHVDPESSGRIGRLLVQNVAVGCTMIMNRRLVELALPMPESVLMHDWWIALVACALGKVGYIHEPTVLYRQHGSNTLGGRRYDMHRILERLCSSAQVRTDLLGTIYQARDLLQAHGSLMDRQKHDIVSRYSTILDRHRMVRVLDMLRYRFFKTGVLRNMATAWVLLSLPGPGRNH